MTTSNTPRAPIDTRALVVAGLAASIAVLAAFDRPLFLGEVYAGQDLGAFHLPMRWFYQRCLELGQPFDWFPNWFNGVYLQGEGQGGFYHPLNALMYRWLPLDVAFNLEILRSHALLLLGTYLFLRRWELTRGAAVFGGMLAAISGASLHHYFMMNVMAGIAHLPILLWAIDVAMRDESRTRASAGAVGVGLLTGSQLLLGHPQMVFASGLFEGGYLLLMLRMGCGVRRLLRVGAALGLGVLIGFVQLLPMLDTMSKSVREAAPTGLGSAVAFHPLDLSQLFAPYLFKRGAIADSAFSAHLFRSDLSLYASLSAPVLILWLLSQPRGAGRDRRLLWAVAIGGALIMLLAMGHAGGLYKLQLMLPLAGNFRTPARYGLLVDIAIAIAAAMAMDRLIRASASPAPADPQTRGPRRHLVWLAPTLAICIPLAALCARHFQVGPPLSSFGWVAAGPLLALAATGLVVAAARGHRLALIGLIALTALDLAVYSLRYVWNEPAVVIAERWGESALPPDFDFEHRILWGHTGTVMSDARMATGLVAMVPKQFTILAAVNGKVSENGERFARLSSAAWRTNESPSRDIDPIARVRVLQRAIVSDDPLMQLDAIDIETTALLSSELRLEPGPPGSAAIIEETPGTLRLEVESPTRQLLVISESYHEGWRLSEGSDRCEVVAVYGVFLGCVVGPETREVELIFEPVSLARGRAISLVGFGGLLLWSANLVRIGRRRQVDV